jgi:hypothetical protein
LEFAEGVEVRRCATALVVFVVSDSHAQRCVFRIPEVQVAELSFQEFHVAGWDTVRLDEKGRDEGRRSEQTDEFVTRMPIPEVNARVHGYKKGEVYSFTSRYRLKHNFKVPPDYGIESQF